MENTLYYGDNLDIIPPLYPGRASRAASDDPGRRAGLERILSTGEEGMKMENTIYYGDNLDIRLIQMQKGG